MGHSVHHLRRRNGAAHAPLRLRALPRRVAAGGDGGLLPRGQAARTGHRGVSGQEEAAGLVHAGGGRGAVGVWVLFRCELDGDGVLGMGECGMGADREDERMQVAIRAFFPVWVWLYVMQFILWPLIARDNW